MINQQNSPIERTSSRSIRVRLILAFLTAALLPFVGISFILTISQGQSVRQTAKNQLGTVLTYKRNAILSWSNAVTADLSNALLGENTQQQIQQILITSSASPEYQQVRQTYNIVRQRFITQIQQSPYYSEIFLLNTQGVVVLSSENAQEGQDYNQRAFFLQGLQETFLEAPSYSTALARPVMFVSRPILSGENVAIGVIAGRVRMEQLDQLLNDRAGLGETGKTYLVNADKILVAGFSEDEQGKPINSVGLDIALQQLTTGATDQPMSASYYNDFRLVPVLGVNQAIPEIHAVLMAEQDSNELTRGTFANLAVSASVAISSILVALFIALMVTHGIATPVTELAHLSRQIAGWRGSAGENSDSAAAATIEFNTLREGAAALARQETNSDEIGLLAQAFEDMAGELTVLIGSLEERVQERTRLLQIRSNYLEASTEVGRATASFLDPDELIEQAAEVIRQRFGLYYVGIFLADEKRQWADLRAGTGEAGKNMIARGHRVPIGRTSMIGWCIANAQARIAQVAASDTVRITNPELPDTRSEAAIPLRSRGQVVGAISIQSQEINAFDDTSIAALQFMADQLAIAIHNARLYTQSQEAIEAERRAYTTQSQTAWNRWLEGNIDTLSTDRLNAEGQSSDSITEKTTFTVRAAPGSEIARRGKPVWSEDMQRAFDQGTTVTEQSDERKTENSVAIPILVRGNTIGVLRVAQAEQAWTQEEVAFLESIGEQLGIALDSARLYSETQRKAEQERQIGAATSRMRASLDIESVLKTAVEEIYQMLNPSIEGQPAGKGKAIEHITIQLGGQS